MTTTFTKTDKLIRALAPGKNVSVRALETRTGLQNLSATVDRLRRQGFDIRNNLVPNSRGEIVSHYRMVA